MTDRFPTKTGGEYTPPGAEGFGLGVHNLRDSILREFGFIAEALRGTPKISVNTIPNIWIPGAELSLVSAAVAPAAVKRGEFPCAEYVAGGDREGTVSTRVIVPGLYRYRLCYAQDAPGGGIVTWYCRVSLLGSEFAEGTGPDMAAVGRAYNLSINGTAGANASRWLPVADLFIPDRCAVGLSVGRMPAVAPDTGTADAFVIGLSLERIRSHP